MVAGRLSSSAMLPAVVVKVCPTCGVPSIPGLPVAGLLAAALTVMTKASLTEAPSSSLAVTFTETVPASAAAGVPEKVRVPASKLSHDGNALSSSSTAV